MNNTDKKIIEKFKRLLVKKVKVKNLILFGSRARGDNVPYSDMDIFIVVDNLDTETENYISDCAWEAGIEEGIVVVPITFSTYEWENSPERSSLLVKAVMEEGIRV